MDGNRHVTDVDTVLPRGSTYVPPVLNQVKGLRYSTYSDEDGSMPEVKSNTHLICLNPGDIPGLSQQGSDRPQSLG